MKTRTLLLSSVALLAIASAMPAQAEKPFTLTNTTTVTSSVTDSKTFVTKAAIGGMFEVKSSKLALKRSTNPEVKKFAQMMIDDHTKANEKLKSILHDKQEDDLVPTALDKHHQAKLDALKSSDNFDADYLQAQKDGHTKTIALFESYAANGDDEDLKDFATKTLPTLKKHKAHLDKINS
jgi:putative membrane protein